MTAEIAQALWEHLQPRAVGVVIAAWHCCMSCRGVNKPVAQMVTRTLLGQLRDDPQTRSEFLNLCDSSSRLGTAFAREESVWEHVADLEAIQVVQMDER